MEKKPEIVAIHNNYKNILDNFINIPDERYLDQQRLINKRLRNAPRFESILISLSEINCCV